MDRTSQHPWRPAGRIGCQALLLVLLHVGSASAQEIDSDMYDGRWNVAIADATGKYRPAARVVIANYAGQWTDLPARAAALPKACRAKPFKVTVQASRPSRLEFMVWGSSVAAVCTDLPVLLKPVDDKTLEGSLGDDARVRLTRR